MVEGGQDLDVLSRLSKKLEAGVAVKPEGRAARGRIGNGNQKRDPYGHVKRGPPGLACQHFNPASSERGGARVAHRREPAIPGAADLSREAAVPIGSPRSAVFRGTSWTAGTLPSRPGRKAHICCGAEGRTGCHPQGRRAVSMCQASGSRGAP